jgi:hypothetical protein
MAGAAEWPALPNGRRCRMAGNVQRHADAGGETMTTNLY